MERRSAKKCPLKRLRNPIVRAAPTDESIKKGERTRTALLEAAYQLFITKGYHATSTRDIASAAGLAVGGIYNYFRTKEDIYLALFTKHQALLDIPPALAQARGETIEELVHDAAARMIDVLGERHQGSALMFVEMAEFRGKHLPLIFKAVYPAFMEFAQRLTQVRGVLRDRPLPIMLRVFLGLFFSYRMTDFLMGQRPAGTKKWNAFDDFVDIYLHGIVAGD